MIDDAAAEAMSHDDHRRGFAAGIASLLGEFEVYLSQKGADPTADMVTYQQVSLWLSDAEKAAALYEGFIAAVRIHLDHNPPPDRRRHLSATIMFPAQVDP